MVKKELPSESGSRVLERDASSQIICERRQTSLQLSSPKLTAKPSLTKGRLVKHMSHTLISASTKKTMF